MKQVAQQQRPKPSQPFVFTNYTANTITTQSIMLAETQRVKKQGNCFLSSWQVRPRQVKMVKCSPSMPSLVEGKLSLLSKLPPASTIVKPSKMRNQCTSIQHSKLSISFILNPTVPLVKMDAAKEFSVALHLNSASLHH